MKTCLVDYVILVILSSAHDVITIKEDALTTSVPHRHLRHDASQREKVRNKEEGPPSSFRERQPHSEHMDNVTQDERQPHHAYVEPHLRWV